MSASIVETREEQLVGACVVEALRAGVERRGSAVLLVPDFDQALSAQRTLAELQGLSLAVTTTTPSAWVKERWEVWGDGRSIADASALAVLAYQTLASATADERGPIELSAGVVRLVARLAAQALPWLPLDEHGDPQQEACAQAGLTQAETRLLALVGALGSRLAERGLVTEAEASSRLPVALREAGAHLPQVTYAGFTRMGRRDRELVRALGELTDVTVVLPACEGAAAQEPRRLASLLGLPTHQDPRVGAVTDRAPGIARLLETLFTGERLTADPNGPVELLLAAGPVAEAELVARRIARLVADAPEAPAQVPPQVVVAVPDVPRAWRELAPKLAGQGLAVRASWSEPLSQHPFARAFLSFARVVADLAERSRDWPAAIEGPEGPVQQLGDMGWWPPRELIDFLLSDVAHVPVERAWRIDASWRGNRLLSPVRVLEMLQAERETSAPVARATTELLRGRIGAAASKLLAPYLADGQTMAVPGAAPAVLQAIIRLAGTLHELGISADPKAAGHLGLPALVELFEWASAGRQVVTRHDVAGRPGAPLVRLMGLSEAASLPPGSLDTLVLCGLTTAEQPISSGDDALGALLEQLGVEPEANPMAEARTAFRALVAAPRGHLVLERTLHDAEGQDSYPSVMLSELLACYETAAGPSLGSLPQTRRAETDLGRNLDARGERPRHLASTILAPAGRLTEQARELVFVPQAGREVLPGGKPVLSASQIETYLDCPYKWFSLRRLRLGQVDAGHTGMEMGTFAHRVLEVTHRELLERALVAQAPGAPPEELLAALAADPTRPVAGSRVDEGTLDTVRTLLEQEFDRHQRHMYQVRRPTPIQQLLVAHDSFERAQEDRLREDLLSSLDYQTRILQGFEPRLFEWSFGRGDDLVEYAGAFFTGTVDRIDVSPHGTAVIIDYKHKSPNGFAAEYDALQEGVLEGAAVPPRVQSLIYAQVVRRAFAGRLRLVGTTYLATRSPHALAGAADENVADLVFGTVSAKRHDRVCVPRTEEGEPGMNELLDRTEELVAEQVEQMLAGNVEARPRGRHSCDFCPVVQCERRVAR